MQTLGVFHLKGGVGKSTSAVNLAWSAAHQGLRTVLWDLDPQGSASWYLDAAPKASDRALKLFHGKTPVGKLRLATPYPKLSVIPADESLRSLNAVFEGEGKDARKRLERCLSALGEDASVLIFDCPPALGSLADGILSSVDALLVPLIPSPLSLRAWAQVRAFMAEKKRRRVTVLPFFTMVDRRRNLHTELLATARDQIPELLETWIPYASVVEQMGVHRAPLETFAPHSPAARAYAALWAEICQRVRLR